MGLQSHLSAIRDDAATHWLRHRITTNPPSFNFVAQLSGNFGLGMAARNTFTSLDARGIPMRVSDVIIPGQQRGGEVTTHCSPGQNDAHRNPHPINFFHLNPTEILWHLWHSPGFGHRNRINVALPFWEIEDLPDSWTEVLGGMDVVLTPTSFVADAVRRSLPSARIMIAPQSVALPPRVTADRARWDLPDSATVFATSFDLASDVSRKNPMATIKAFQKAFPDGQDVRLVLKTQPCVTPELKAAARSLEALTSPDRRIRHVSETLSPEALWRLYASADVFVSLHRSEGLGLGLMEAMALGVPVVATNYSGPVDFLTEENSITVPYTLVPVESSNPAYAPMTGVSHWADPSVPAAASAMRALHEDPLVRRGLGARAKHDMEERARSTSAGDFVAKLHDLMRSDDGLWAEHPSKAAIIRSLSRPLRPPLGAIRHTAAVKLKRSLQRPAARKGPVRD